MDDGFLIAQVNGGNRNAFRLLVVRYQRAVFRFLGGFGLEQAAAEELAQETFLRAFRSLADYDAGKASFSSWLFAIAKHLAINESARSHRRAQHVDAGTSESELCDRAPASTAEDALAAEERHHRLRQALRDLPATLRSALVLAYMKELSMDDIAAIESCSVGTIKSRIYRGKQLLRLTLTETED
jgi:RNA polymerase sigma-70 factor, ECF subfamily